MEKDEIEKYIYHRLKVAGSSSDINFTKESIERIYAYSNGVPRLINLVCDRALLTGFVIEAKILDEEIIKKSISEIEGIRERVKEPVN